MALITGSSAAFAFDAALRAAPAGNVSAGGAVLSIAQYNLSGFFGQSPWLWPPNATYQTLVEGQGRLGPAQDPVAGDVGGSGELVMAGGVAATASILDDAADTRVQLLTLEATLRADVVAARQQLLELRGTMADDLNAARTKLARLEHQVIDARHADVLLHTTAGYEEDLGEFSRRTFVTAGTFDVEPAYATPAYTDRFTMDYLAWFTAKRRAGIYAEHVGPEAGVSEYAQETGRPALRSAADVGDFDTSGNRLVIANRRLVGRDILVPREDLLLGRFTPQQLADLAMALKAIDRDQRLGVFSRESGL